MLTVASLAIGQFASARLCLYWLVYHETLGRVNVAKRDNIFLDIFHSSQYCLAVRVYLGTSVCEATFTLRTAAPAVAALTATPQTVRARSH